MSNEEERKNGAADVIGLGPFFKKKEVHMTTPRHCPGFEQFKGLKSFVCNCPNCGKEVEIFSDEFNRKHTCRGCHQEIDFTKCTLTGGASDTTPR